MKPDYNGCVYIIVNGQTVSGLYVASKVSTIICDVELGKPYMLPEYPGRDPARVNDGIEGRGFGKKRMSIRNGSNRGSKFALTRNGADLPDWCFIVMPRPAGGGIDGSLLAIHYARRQTCECK
jgi:hypothetical protein